MPAIVSITMRRAGYYVIYSFSFHLLGLIKGYASTLLRKDDIDRRRA